MKIYTFDCSECGKPIGWSLYKQEQKENVLCLDCIFRYQFVAELVGIRRCDINRIPNGNGELYDKCLVRSLTWNKNVYSSVREIEDE